MGSAAMVARQWQKVDISSSSRLWGILIGVPGLFSEIWLNGSDKFGRVRQVRFGVLELFCKHGAILGADAVSMLPWVGFRTAEQFVGQSRRGS